LLQNLSNGNLLTKYYEWQPVKFLLYCIFAPTMIRYLLFALLAWFLYNLVFRFIIPVYKASRQMKKKFREMHQQMQEHAGGPQDYHATHSGPAKTTSSKTSGDYIDFEEVK
jgi:hypothetical protein